MSWAGGQSVLTLSTTCRTTKIFQTGHESEMKNKPKDVTLGGAVKTALAAFHKEKKTD